MTHLLCIDTEPETVQSLREAGHDVTTGELGYRTGRPLLESPPHEYDLLVCDLKRPACFDATHWGPGKNDNFHCRIEETVKDVMYRSGNSRPRPKFELIKTSQMPPRPAGTFGPEDIFKAVAIAGVPLILFLNPEWLRHIAYNSPDFVHIWWDFERTKATKLTLSPIVKELLPEIGESLHFKLPLKFNIVTSAHAEGIGASKHRFRTAPLITNAVSQIFSETVVLDNGVIWALPQFDDNSKVCNVLLEKFDSFLATQSKLLSKGEQPLQDPNAGQFIESTVRDVFISHASEDKPDVARPLVKKLKELGISVWFDEYELTLGDNLRQKIEKGLQCSRYGVTILSHHFFSKRWPQVELDGLFALETGGKKILPVWHNLNEEEIKRYSPILAGRLGISTDKGFDVVAEAISKAVSV